MPISAGKGLQFDGATSFIQITRASIFNAITKYGTYSIEMWIYCQSAPTNMEIIDCGASSNDRNGIGTNTDGSLLCFCYYDGVGYTAASGPMPLGSWVHVVGVNDGGILRLYINGKRQYGSIASSLNNSGTVMRIGNSPSNVRYFNGQISACRIYNRALLFWEVANNYNGLITRDTSLIGEWLMQEGTGTTVADTSGRGNNGTITGATWAVKKQARMLAKTRQLASPVKAKKNMLPDFTKWTRNANANIDAFNSYRLWLNGQSGQNDYNNYYVPVIPSSVYTLSVMNPSGGLIKFQYFDANKVFISSYYASTVANLVTVTGTTPINCYYILIEFSNNQAAGTYNFINPQLESGSVATAFEAYHAVPDNKVAAR